MGELRVDSLNSIKEAKSKLWDKNKKLLRFNDKVLTFKLNAGRETKRWKKFFQFGF
jgi:hypothetical protein